ncbi:hypothetical protein [Paenibacillus azoreducens]|uniref:Uncharacterized protein n=1 Tax=Paenibacillus azoreducens TaxID=116718 RepID=A0A920CN61_9BACL|nr:hypothetical protein [Paenibacillus azoreducens]GIO47111.1 hypothetical protein J34TS1_18760 [Paenibacillus azoreducens]
MELTIQEIFNDGIAESRERLENGVPIVNIWGTTAIERTLWLPPSVQCLAQLS